MVNIGILELQGILTLYENFGHLPTNVVGPDGTIENGKKAHEELDGLIIPGGTLVESESITPEVIEGGDPLIQRDPAHPREKLSGKR